MGRAVPLETPHLFPSSSRSSILRPLHSPSPQPLPLTRGCRDPGDPGTKKPPAQVDTQPPEAVIGAAVILGTQVPRNPLLRWTHSRQRQCLGLPSGLPVTARSGRQGKALWCHVGKVPA